MEWPNSDEQETSLKILSSEQFKTIICSSCGHAIRIHGQRELLELSQTGLQDLPGLPAGVKFDPSDQEILEHLEAKVHSDERKRHPLIDEFIPTIEGENGICYTHPEKLPGVSKDGLLRHFFHRPSKAYTTGTRKRRKVHTDEDGGETRWHKTGKTRPVSASGNVKGYKKILVLYTNYGRQRKPEKTNWVMHQYHLGGNEEEKDGELVVSKVFYQTQPRQCGGSQALKVAHIGSSKSRLSSSKNVNLDVPFVRNASFHVEYYNPQFITYGSCVENQDSRDDGNRDMPPRIIGGMVGHGDGSSSLFHLPSNASKGE